MLFQVSWSISPHKRLECWEIFGNMKPEDDLKDAGENIKVIGRWHQMGGGGGTCICECNNAADLNSWMLNWASICDLTVVPVVEDSVARESLHSKPFFCLHEK
tara:strand:+ start:1518 stop:1826 length:309 start_codon:yes stop_codon:yes gene_type:complete